jgi:hypothetical protein
MKAKRKEHVVDGEEPPPKTRKISTPPPPPTDLAQLLDLSSESLISASSISARFDSIAHALLRECNIQLFVGGILKATFDILELEFYLHKEGCHEDPFTHQSEEQRQRGKW